MTDRIHPHEATLIAWLDESASVDADVEGHVAGCETCAARVAEFRAVFGALAAEAAMPDATALAESRGRIADAIQAPAEPEVRSLTTWRPVAWAAVLAAAALAALLPWSPRGEEPPASTGRIVADAPAPRRIVADHPVVDEGERAAEAVVAAALPEPADDLAEAPLDDATVESLAEMETATPSLVDESIGESTGLAEQFASLTEEDQTAILDELSEMTFEL